MAASTTDKPLRETDVLKPRDPELVDENKWEEFQLFAAEVYDAAGELASLLHADAVSPVTVVGRLKKRRPHLAAAAATWPFPKAGVVVELTNVTHFAYADFEDGSKAFWAAGAAGWFELTPSTKYRPIYNSMADAIDALYRLADFNSKQGGPRSPARGTSAEDIFRRYAATNPRRFPNKHAAQELIYQHKDFLMLAMLQGKALEAPPWIETDIFDHLRRKFPAEYDAVKRKNAGKAGVANRKRATGQTPNQKAGSHESSSSEATRKKNSPARTAPKKDNNWWEAKAVWEMMQKVHIQGLICPRNMTVDNFAKVMVRTFELDDAELAADYIKAHASNLTYMMEHRKRPAVEWPKQPVYTQLINTKVSAKALERASRLLLRRRKDPLPVSGTDLVQQQQEPDSSTDGIPRAVHQHKRNTRRSLLRPKSSKHVGKGMTRSGTSYHPSSGDEDDDDTDNADTPPRLKRKAGVAEESASRKRKASRSQSQSAGATPSPEADSGKKEHLPLRWKVPHSQEDTDPAPLPIIVSVPLPSMEANSPGDVWRCTHDGCMHKVYGARLEKSQLLIAEHLDEHDAEIQKAVALAKSEELRSNLPVSNLIKLIRNMADEQQNRQLMGLAGSGNMKAEQTFPTPIQRYF